MVRFWWLKDSRFKESGASARNSAEGWFFESMHGLPCGKKDHRQRLCVGDSWYHALPIRLFSLVCNGLSYFVSDSGSNSRIPFFLDFSNYRLRVRHHSERDTTSLTPPAVDAERLLSTSKSPDARLADTPTRRWDNLTGASRLRADAQKELVACDTWRPWPANLRMDSEREPWPRSKLRHNHLVFQWTLPGNNLLSWTISGSIFAFVHIDVASANNIIVSWISRQNCVAFSLPSY